MGKIFSDFVCFSESTNFKETFPESVDQKIDCLMQLRINTLLMLDSKVRVNFRAKYQHQKKQTSSSKKSHFSIAPEK